MFASATESAGLQLTIDCEPLSRPAYVDPDQWAKIVLNLVSNALKYTFEGGITVRLREEDGHAVLTVADTGTGIPDAELPGVFERFHRVPGARSRTIEGSGTTFTVRVPQGADHLPADRVVDDEGTWIKPRGSVERAQGVVQEALRWLAEPEDAPVAQPQPATQHGRVLVVEDNADMRDYVAGLLSDEYDVVTATDGIDALEKLADFRPDLVLTDVMMPRLDGFGLLERLHGNPATTGIPVIMLSARAGEEGTVEGLEAGADDYLVKPSSARELKARIRVNMELDRNRRVRESLERTGLLLDQAQRLAKVASWEVDLLTDKVRASDELWRMFDRSQEDFDRHGFSGMVEDLVVAEDQQIISDAFSDARLGGLVGYDVRIRPSDDVERLVSVRGEVVEEQDGQPRVLRGSIQDITEQRKAELALAAASAFREAAAREHSIADELQRSLLPERSFDLEHLDVATYYRAGVEGTQLGGD